MRPTRGAGPHDLSRRAGTLWLLGAVAQMARAPALQAGGRGFDSRQLHSRDLGMDSCLRRARGSSGQADGAVIAHPDAGVTGTALRTLSPPAPNQPETRRGPDPVWMVVMAGLREQNKARRRAAILDATAALLRERPFDQVTVEEIAELASVAPATVYNLVGTREHLLVGLIDRVIEELIETLAELSADGADDPIGVARAIVDRSVDVFVADSTVFRQVVASWTGDDIHRRPMATDPAQLQITAMRRAQDAGIIRPDLDPRAIGQQIYISYNGAFLLWALGGLDDAGFRSTARHGLLATLAAAASDDHRSALHAELRSLGSDVARTTRSERGTRPLAET